MKRWIIAYAISHRQISLNVLTIRRSYPVEGHSANRLINSKSDTCSGQNMFHVTIRCSSSMVVNSYM